MDGRNLRFGREMPPADYVIEDVALSDPIFHSQIEVKRVPQVSGIGFWRASGGRITFSLAVVAPGAVVVGDNYQRSAA